MRRSTVSGPAWRTMRAVGFVVLFSFYLRAALGPVSYSYEYRRDLKMGSLGADVAELQSALEDAGYLRLTDPERRGEFGSLTRRSLMRLQRERGIASTGVFFGATKALLSLRPIPAQETRLLDFAQLCSMPTKLSYMGLFGHTEIEILGTDGGRCRLRFGMESEDPGWDHKLDHDCRVPTRKFVFRLSDQTGLDLSPIAGFCRLSR